MIIQGCWQHESVFRNIPYFNDKIIRKLAHMEIYHLCQLLPKLDRLTDFFKQELKEKMSTEQLKIIYSALSRIPVVQMKYYIQAVNSMGDPTSGPLSEGSEAVMTVSLERKQAKSSTSVIVKSFPKPKDAGWFVIVGNPVTNELMAIKRVPLKKFTKRELQILLPNDFVDEKIKLYLLSDAYIGIDQVITIDCRKVSSVLEQIAEGKLPEASLKDQLELVQNMKDDSDSDYEHREDERDRNELSDSDYTDDSFDENASDISDDLIEKNIDCWI